jgi:hypothetical protein
VILVVVDEVNLEDRNVNVLSYMLDGGQLAFDLAKHLIVAGEATNAAPAIFKVEDSDIMECAAGESYNADASAI